MKKGRKMGEDREKTQESRAVTVALQGGGMVMFSCTSEGADVAEAFVEERRKARKTIDIQDIVNAVRDKTGA